MWRTSMSEEIKALRENSTWTLVPRHCVPNVVRSKWIYHIKRHSDGSIERRKSRIVAKGFHQCPGIDYNDTFNPMVKPRTICLLLSIALGANWSIKQLDISNAFLQGTLDESVFMEQPQGFIDPHYPDNVCVLRKSIYGLK